jgi:predicted N-formylglutamate amidohydrolase
MLVNNVDETPHLLRLKDDEVPPVLEESCEGQSAYLLVADHFGGVIPRVLGDLGVPSSELKRHIAYDIGIAGVAQCLAKALDAHLVAQRYSRLVIDCNRPPIAASSIPTVSENTAVPGSENLTSEARLDRRRLFFDPYHQFITETINRRDRAARKTVLVSLHSFAPLYHGSVRPWHVGALYNRDSRVSHTLIDWLRREPGLMVGDNEPYCVDDETDYTIPVHAERRGLLHTGIEIRQDLIADENGQRQWADRLTHLFREIEPNLPNAP